MILTYYGGQCWQEESNREQNSPLSLSVSHVHVLLQILLADDTFN